MGSGLRAALLMMVVAGVVQGQDYSGTMLCQCECATDCTSGDSVYCNCPEPAFACAPGFTQVCPLDAGACPAGMSRSVLEVVLPQRPPQRQQQRQRHQHFLPRLSTLGKLSAERSNTSVIWRSLTWMTAARSHRSNQVVLPRNPNAPKAFQSQLTPQTDAL